MKRTLVCVLALVALAAGNGCHMMGRTSPKAEFSDAQALWGEGCENGSCAGPANGRRVPAWRGLRRPGYVRGRTLWREASRRAARGRRAARQGVHGHGLRFGRGAHFGRRGIPVLHAAGPAGLPTGQSPVDRALGLETSGDERHILAPKAETIAQGIAAAGLASLVGNVI